MSEMVLAGLFSVAIFRLIRLVRAVKMARRLKRLRVILDKCRYWCSGSEAGSFLRLIDSCITQLKSQGPSRTCNESKEEVSVLLERAVKMPRRLKRLRVILDKSRCCASCFTLNPPLCIRVFPPSVSCVQSSSTSVGTSQTTGFD